MLFGQLFTRLGVRCELGEAWCRARPQTRAAGGDDGAAANPGAVPRRSRRRGSDRSGRWRWSVAAGCCSDCRAELVPLLLKPLREADADGGGRPGWHMEDWRRPHCQWCRARPRASRFTATRCVPYTTGTTYNRMHAALHTMARDCSQPGRTPPPTAASTASTTPGSYCRPRSCR